MSLCYFVLLLFQKITTKQTSEHLAAVEIMRLKDIIILQNKIDLVTESVAQNQFESIQKFIQGTIAGLWGFWCCVWGFRF